MPIPEVVRLALQHAKDLENKVEDVTHAMANQWLYISHGLDDKITQVSREISNLQAQGKPVTEAWLNEQKYYKALYEQSRNQIAQYVDWGESYTEQQVLQAALLGIDHASEMYLHTTQGMGYFKGIPAPQIESIQAITMRDAPLGQLFQSIKLSYMGVHPLTEALMNGLAMGMPMNKIAELMTQAVNMPFKRSLLIARTEINRAHRSSTLQTYREAEIPYYRRLASRGHACFACMMLDGTLYTSQQALDDHPNGACVMVPVLDPDDPSTDWKRGRQRFEEMDEPHQREIMGNNYYDAWKRGDYRLSQVVQIKQNSIWGGSPGLVPLKTLSPNWKSYRAAAPKMPAAIASTTGLSIDTPLTVAQRQAALDRLNSLGNEGLYEKVRLLAMNKAGLAGATQTEIDAFKEYTGLGYTTLNYDLRRASKLSKADAALDKHMAEVYLKLPPTEGDMVVVRGLGDWKPEDAVVGGKIVDPGYMSTSLTNSFWGNRYEIYVPAGSGNVAFIRDISRIKSEDELLFNKNSVLEVLEITRKGEYNTYKLIYKGNLGD